MPEVVERTDHAHFLAEIEKVRGLNGQDWVRQYRESGAALFESLPFPSHRDEAWRSTDIRPIVNTAFRAIVGEPAGTVAASDFANAMTVDDAPTAVFVDGLFDAGLSRLDTLPAGLTVMPLSEAIGKSSDELEQRLIEQVTNAFGALNAAFLQDGVFIEVAPNAVIDVPLQVIFVSSSAEPVISNPRNVVVLGESSELKLVETYYGVNDGASYFTNAVSELTIGANAKLERYKVVQEGAKAYHLETAHVSQGRDSRFKAYTMSLTGQIIRNELRVKIAGAGSEASLNGLYLNDGDRVIDNALNVEHIAPNCRSRMVYKGILGETSTAVFTGKVYVHRSAQKTDSDQLNQNLLRADTASVDTRPQLEIFADDVKCTHGATIGGFPPEVLFYFQSRGIDAGTANGILTFGFAQEIVDEIEVEDLHDKIGAYVFEKYQPRKK